jgi:hypothetical protein
MKSNDMREERKIIQAILESEQWLIDEYHYDGFARVIADSNKSPYGYGSIFTRLLPHATIHCDIGFDTCIGDDNVQCATILVPLGDCDENAIICSLLSLGYKVCDRVISKIVLRTIEEDLLGEDRPLFVEIV